MAKRALGPHWRQRTPAEQEEFVKLFRDFLERVYSEKMFLYAGERVRLGREVIDNEFAQVESTIIQLKGEEIAVVYKLRQVNGQWKVYDAIVENISIINNYRSQFDRVISSSPYEELVKRLREKVGWWTIGVRYSMKDFLTTKGFMILRSPTEHENRDLRHAGMDSGIQICRMRPETSVSAWIPALHAGMTESRDSTS